MEIALDPLTKEDTVLMVSDHMKNEDRIDIDVDKLGNLLHGNLFDFYRIFTINRKN